MGLFKGKRVNAQTEGTHLTIDALVEESDLLFDEKLLVDLLHETVDLVGMKVLVPAKMIKVDLDSSKTGKDDGDDGGITGVAILNTSHVSIHTWPLTNRFAFDLYSCRVFDATLVFNLLKVGLGITDATVKVNSRRSPKNKSGVNWFYTE